MKEAPSTHVASLGGTQTVSHQVWVPLAVLLGIQPLSQASDDDVARAGTLPGPRTGGLQPLELPWLPQESLFWAEKRALTWGRRVNIGCGTGSKVQLRHWAWLWAGAAWEEGTGQCVLPVFWLSC